VLQLAEHSAAVKADAQAFQGQRAAFLEEQLEVRTAFVV
jgi:hypothetical protein